jgi:hypothetical protein
MPQPSGWPSSIIVTVTNCIAAGVTSMAWNDAATRFEGGDFFTSEITDSPPVEFTLDTMTGAYVAVYSFAGGTFTLVSGGEGAGNYMGGTVTLTNPEARPPGNNRLSLGIGLGLCFVIAFLRF